MDFAEYKAFIDEVWNHAPNIDMFREARAFNMNRLEMLAYVANSVARTAMIRNVGTTDPQRGNKDPVGEKRAKLDEGADGHVTEEKEKGPDERCLYNVNPQDQVRNAVIGKTVKNSTLVADVAYDVFRLEPLVHCTETEPVLYIDKKFLRTGTESELQSSPVVDSEEVDFDFSGFGGQPKEM